MAIEQFYVGSSGSSLVFGGIHGVMQSSPWTQPTQTLAMPGTIGISQLLDYRRERQLTCEFRIHGYASYEDLSIDLEAFDAQNQTVTGAVVFTGTLEFTYEECTFMTFERGLPKYDGSGANGWWVEGRLIWIQRSPNT